MRDPTENLPDLSLPDLSLPDLSLPDIIENESELLEVLTRPSPALCKSIVQLASPLVILGAGGKMGPTLAVLAHRAAQAAGHPLRVIATSRFRDASSKLWLNEQGIETITTDVFDRNELARLPDTANVLYLVGMKFGTSSNPTPTWITNTLGPIYAAERFAGAKFVALSTGNVYPLSEIDRGGSCESDALTPLGEYANAAVARERIFQHFTAVESRPSPTTVVRLNYAHDLRYGVISDIASKVWNNRSVDLTMGYFNAIWQGDANEFILRSFELCSTPATAINITSNEYFSVRETAVNLGQMLDRDPRLTGLEQTTALISNTAKMVEQFGRPRVDYQRLVAWIANWTATGGRMLGKPTHFETRDGAF